MKTKRILFTLVSITFIAGIIMVSCKPANKEETESQGRVQVAKENVQDAKDSLAVARKAATNEEWRTFKHNSDSIISDNEAQIAELKLRMKKTGKSIDAKYQENIAILEQKNRDLKVKIDTYQHDANSDWQSFKREFNHDMEGVGKAFRDLTVDNNK